MNQKPISWANKAGLPMCAAVLTLIATTGILNAQPTSFNLSGRLSNVGLPVSGNYDLRFNVYGSQSGSDLISGPVTLVSVGIKGGLFNTKMDFGSQVFTGDPRWLNVEVRPTGTTTFTNLSPRLELNSTPYAIRAREAAMASNVVSGAVVKSLNNLKDNVTLAAGANVTITPSGNTLTIGASGGGGGNWSVLGTNVFYNTGNVGIGTNAPGGKLEIAGVQDALRITAYQPVMTFRDTGLTNARSAFQSAGGGMNIFSEDYLSGANTSAFLRLNKNGRVGIGAANPSSTLDIVSPQDALRITGYNPVMTFFDSGAGYARSAFQSVGGSLNMFSEDYLSGANTAAFVQLNKNGNVGIGVANPQARLDVISSQHVLNGAGYQPFITLRDSGAGYARVAIQDIGGEMILSTEAALNGSTPSAYLRLNSAGNVSVGSLTIRGGADLAEPFDLSEADIAAGSVVVIDPAQPGKLQLSRQAYDTKVAGIVSGANGVNPGISLRQEGAVSGEHNVALSGRVYVQADAGYGEIKPGDLLTTSDTPGHAMKVTDHGKAQGAILGKAMSALREGKGTVLVLVSLQ